MNKLWLAATLLASPALAQDAQPQAAPGDEIVVTAIKGMWALEGKRIRAAQAAFFAGRDRYAPGSRMFFQIVPKGEKSAEALRLTLRKGDDSEDVPIESDLRFGIRPLDSDDWKLIANRKPSEIGVRLWILSPGSSEGDRRLGDLRLYCRVGWALVSDRFNFLQRAAFNTMGGCDSRRLMIFTSAQRPISEASVTTPDGAARPLKVVNNTRYQLPIADQSLPDTARVRLTYR